MNYQSKQCAILGGRNSLKMTIHFCYSLISPPKKKLGSFFCHDPGKHPCSKIEGKKPTPFFFDQKIKSPLPATASPDFLTTSDFLYCRARLSGLSGRNILPPNVWPLIRAPPATRGSKRANGNGRRRKFTWRFWDVASKHLEKHRKFPYFLVTWIAAFWG